MKILAALLLTMLALPADTPSIRVGALPSGNPVFRIDWAPHPEPLVNGYVIYWGPASKTYTNSEVLTGRMMTNYPPVSDYSKVPPYPVIRDVSTNLTIFYMVVPYFIPRSPPSDGRRREGDPSNELSVNPDFWRSNRVSGVVTLRIRP